MNELFYPSPIADYILHSAEKYYDYLTLTGKGVEYIEVKNVTQNNTGTHIYKYEFTLYFKTKIPNFDFVSEIRFDSKKIHIHHFDFIAPTPESVIVRATEEQVNLFKKAEKIILVVDFRELVWRIREKFLNDRDLFLPTAPSSLSFDKTKFNDIQFSDIQLNAINNIFSNPISYIWGAAGSGKTRFVLTYAIINYLLQNRIVLITAPTNIALENAMSAIIPEAEKYGISKFSIRRLGPPSADFKTSFPECCDNYVDIELNRFVKKCSNLEQYISYSDILTQCETLEHLVSSILTAQNCFGSLSAKKQTVSLERNLKQKQLKDAQAELLSLNNTINNITTKRSLFSYKVKRFISSLDPLKEELTVYLDKLSDTDKQIKSLTSQIKQLNSDISAIDLSLKNTETQISKFKKDIAQQLSRMPADFKIDDSCSYLNIKNLISEYNADIFASLSKIKSLYPDIDFTDIPSVKSCISDITSQISSRNKQNEKARNNVLLYGCTLDKLASTSFNVLNHVFLDEACYSCIAKAAQLFLFQCPVTFLGDHMQLPPISNIDDKVLKNDKNLTCCFLWSQNAIYSPDLFTLDFETMFKNYISHTDKLPDVLSISSLNETHRFGNKLAEVLDKFVYKNNFHSALTSDTEILFLNVKRLTPIYAHASTKPVRRNSEEANAIYSYLKNHDINDCAVLSPYKEQVNLLRKVLFQTIQPDNILTVHKAQGQEWDTVILSVSDTSNKFFTNSSIPLGKQTLNTTISRAKKTLIIVCDCDHWAHLDNQLISALIQIGKPIT